jgi:TonB family protein
MPEIQSSGTKASDSARIAEADVLEIPVTIQGSKPVEGQERRELFTETTKTTLVFGNGAVVNLTSRLLAGQCVFLRNDQSGRELLCKVLESRPAGQTNYTDLEFTAHDPNFWDAMPVQPAQPEQTATPEQKSESQKKIDAAVESLSATAMMESSTPASEDFPAAISEADVTEPAVTLPETATAAPEHAAARENEQEPNDAEDAEHLAALIAMDDKVHGNRESVPTEAKELQPNVASEGTPEHQAASARTGAGSEGRVISVLELRIRTLANSAALKNPIAIGIAASVLIAAALGVVWHAKHSSSIRSSNRTSAASAASKQQSPPSIAQSSQKPSSTAGTGAAMPAQSAQRTQQPIAAQVSGVKDVQIPAATTAGLGAVRDTRPVQESDEPAVISVKASIPGSDEAVLAKPKHRKANDPVSGETIPAKIVAQSQPGIPEWAKGLDTNGVVQLDALIDEKGNVTETKVLSGPRMLQREAERVVALWIFEPALADGKPTATHMVLTVQFQM